MSSDFNQSDKRFRNKSIGVILRKPAVRNILAMNSAKLLNVKYAEYLTEYLPNENAEYELTEYLTDRLFKTLKPA